VVVRRLTAMPQTLWFCLLLIKQQSRPDPSDRASLL
jgi:hypothetical protein